MHSRNWCVELSLSRPLISIKISSWIVKLCEVYLYTVYYNNVKNLTGNYNLKVYLSETCFWLWFRVYIRICVIAGQGWSITFHNVLSLWNFDRFSKFFQRNMYSAVYTFAVEDYKVITEKSQYTFAKPPCEYLYSTADIDSLQGIVFVFEVRWDLQQLFHYKFAGTYWVCQWTNFENWSIIKCIVISWQFLWHTFWTTNIVIMPYAIYHSVCCYMSFHTSSYDE